MINVIHLCLYCLDLAPLQLYSVPESGVKTYFISVLRFIKSLLHSPTKLYKTCLRNMKTSEMSVEAEVYLDVKEC